MSFVWGAVFVAAVILEILTSALIAVWFIPGALLALVFALLSFPLWVQLFAFFIASLGILFRSRAIIKCNCGIYRKVC